MIVKLSLSLVLVAFLCARILFFYNMGVTDFSGSMLSVIAIYVLDNPHVYRSSVYKF